MCLECPIRNSGNYFEYWENVRLSAKAKIKSLSSISNVYGPILLIVCLRATEMASVPILTFEMTEIWSTILIPFDYHLRRRIWVRSNMNLALLWLTERKISEMGPRFAPYMHNIPPITPTVPFFI